jgi:putative transposase
VLWPVHPRDLTAFVHWLTLTHARRWHRFHNSEGTGAVYQGRFKAIPVQGDCHFYTLVRYVERNPVRAGLVARAEEWDWSSASVRPFEAVRLSPWPLERPVDWIDTVNGLERAEDLRYLRERVGRSLPVGDPDWCHAVLRFGSGESPKPTSTEVVAGDTVAE